MKKLFTLLAMATLCCASVSQAQTLRSKSYLSQGLSQSTRTVTSSANPWHSVPEGLAPSAQLLRMHPTKYLVYSLDVPALRMQLLSAPSNPDEAVVITLPMADGSFRNFRAWQENMLTGEMAERYPDIRTFTAAAVDDQRVTAKLDFTLFGFHAMVFDHDNISFVDPYDNYNDGYYLVHYKRDEYRAPADRMKCGVHSSNDDVAGQTPMMLSNHSSLPANSKIHLPTVNTASMLRTGNGATKRLYEIALSADHFYCQAATGLGTPSIAQCLSAMTTTLNRVNGVYNREIAVQMNYCNKEDTLIWPIATGSINGTDPFTAIDANPGACLTANQTQCDTRIVGSGNVYDVGHVFTTNGGGLAALGVVCNTSQKAQGVTGSTTPVGDGYDIDYVAHEIGHEFGSNHTFNNNQDGSCGGNSNHNTAYEPGSGATIMDYAGICNPDDLQPHSDAYFNASSLKQIITQMVATETTCATTSSTGHDTGTVTRFNYTYNIPYKTPFEFTGPTATVSTGDTAITYQLYQWNLGTSTAPADWGNRLNQWAIHAPIFRSFNPVYTPYRCFPKLSMVLAGTLSNAGTENAQGEKAADTTRDMTIKMAVRNVINGYGCANVLDQDSVLIHAFSTGTTGAFAGFKVTSQGTTGIIYAGSSTQTVQWNVVGTNLPPVSADSVDIFMSVDGGNTWPYTIGRFINSGTASVTIPNPAVTSTTSRIKVKGKNNIFFNINSNNFTVTAVVVTAPITGTFTVCPTGTTTLADVTTPGTWSSSTTGVATVGLNNGVVTGVSAGTTIITYTASAGIATAIVTVMAPPSGGTITGTATACIGFTTTLSDATPGGIWSSFNTAVATINASGVVTGMSAGTSTISYVVTGACGTGTAIKVVTVSAPTAVAPITGVLSVCQGSNTTLNDVTPLGTWSSNNTAVATVNASGVVTGAAAGTTTISYNVTGGSGCISSAVAIVTVNAMPSGVVLPSGTITICTGGNATLTASTGAGYTYQWHNGAGTIAGATNSTYVASAADNYYVTITGTGGCITTSATVTVVVSAGFTVVPSVTITTSGGAAVCAGTSVTFTANPVNGGTAPAYQWYINGVLAGTGTTYTYMPADGDTVKSQMISNAPCASPTTVSSAMVMSVSAAATPSVTVMATPNDTVCTGDPVTYIAVPVFGGTAPTYLWIENGINVGTGPTYTPATAHNGDNIVCVMNSNYACRTATVAVSPTFTMHVLAPVTNTITVSASATSITSGSSVTFIALAPYATSYQWYIDGTAVAGATSSVFVTSAIVDGNVVNCAVTGSLCALPATVISGGLTMHVSSGVVDTKPTIFNIMPNPTRGAFTVTGTLGHTADNTVALSVVNMLGQVVYRADLQATNGGVEAHVVLNPSLANGMYLVKLTAGDEHAVFHLLLER